MTNKNNLFHIVSLFLKKDISLFIFIKMHNYEHKISKCSIFRFSSKPLSFHQHAFSNFIGEEFPNLERLVTGPTGQELPIRTQSRIQDPRGMTVESEESFPFLAPQDNLIE